MSQKSRSGKTSKINFPLQKFLKNRGLEDVYYLIGIQKNWPVIVGEQLSQKTLPAKLVDHVLTIKVVDAAYAHHLRYISKTILEYVSPICEHLGKENKVKFLKFIVGEVPRFHEVELEETADGLFRKANTIQLFTEKLLFELRENWSIFVGRTLAKKSHPLKIEEGVLTVSVSDSDYAFYLRNLKSNILSSIDPFCEQLGYIDRLKQINIISGDVPEMENSLEEESSDKSLLSETIIKKIGAATNPLSDRFLRKKFKKAMLKNLAKHDSL